MTPAEATTEASAHYLLTGTQTKTIAAHSHSHAANTNPVSAALGHTVGTGCVPHHGPEREAGRSGSEAELEGGPKFTEVEDDEWLEGVL